MKEPDRQQESFHPEPIADTGEAKKSGKGRALAIVGLAGLFGAAAVGYSLVGAQPEARVESRDRVSPDESANKDADRAIAGALSELDRKPASAASKLDETALAAGDVRPAVEPVTVDMPPPSARTGEPSGVEPEPRPKPEPEPNSQKSIWFRSEDPRGRGVRGVNVAVERVSAPGPVKPSFGAVLPVRTLGATVTLRQGSLARLEVTRDIEGRGWSLPRGTVVVAITRGAEFDRAYYEMIGFIDSASGRLVRLGGDVLGPDGASGVRGKRRHMQSAWSRAFGWLKRSASTAIDQASREWVSRRIGSGQTIVIPDLGSAPFAAQFSSAAEDRAFVEVPAGTLCYVMVSELPATVAGVDALVEMQADEIAEYADVAKANPKTGLPDAELAEIVASGSSEQIRAALPRMSAEMRRIAESVLSAGR